MSSPPLKPGLISLGCAKNLVDSEVMLGAPQIDGCVNLRGRATVGEFAHVRVTGAGAYELMGEVVAEHGARVY